MDELLCSYKGLPKGVNYMVIGDPGVGKTTIILDMLSDLSVNSGARVLFVSVEMNEIDLAIYVQRFPKFQNLDILFIEGNFEQGSSGNNTFDTVSEVLSQGWDVIAIDSFYELQGIVKEEENITLTLSGQDSAVGTAHARSSVGIRLFHKRSAAVVCVLQYFLDCDFLVVCEVVYCRSPFIRNLFNLEFPEALSLAKNPLKKYALADTDIFIQLPELPAVVRVSYMTQFMNDCDNGIFRITNKSPVV